MTEVFLCKTSTLSGNTDVLAGESTTQDIGGDSIGSQSSCRELADVRIAGDSWPVSGEHPSAVRFNFAEGDSPESSGTLKPDGETADS